MLKKTEQSVKEATQEPWLPVMRELVRSYQAFSDFDGHHIKQLGLTPAQFDIVATLGNTEGMTFKQLGAKTLITKGALTGIIDRLELKGIVRRVPLTEDRRSIIAQLTPKGQAMFEQVFPIHIQYLAPSFNTLSVTEQKTLVRLLKKLKSAWKKN